MECTEPPLAPRGGGGGGNLRSPHKMISSVGKGAGKEVGEVDIC